MMKKMILCILTLLMAGTFCSGCNAKSTVYKADDYTITQIDGKYYMNFYEKYEPPAESVSSSCAIADYPKFTSVSEMKTAIETGNFSESELETLRMNSYSADSKENGTLEICNPAALYDLAFPKSEDFYLSHIIWYGTSYSFELRGSIPGYLKYTNSEVFSKKFQAQYTNFFEQNQIELISQETVSDRNATVYTYKTFAGKFLSVRYTITGSGKTMYIDENYIIEWYRQDSPASVSDTVPHVIKVWCIDNGNYLYGGFREFTERPSVAWLTSFGLREYVEAG